MPEPPAVLRLGVDSWCGVHIDVTPLDVPELAP